MYHSMENIKHSCNFKFPKKISFSGTKSNIGKFGVVIGSNFIFQLSVPAITE